MRIKIGSKDKFFSKRLPHIQKKGSFRIAKAVVIIMAIQGIGAAFASTPAFAYSPVSNNQKSVAPINNRSGVRYSSQQGPASTEKFTVPAASAPTTAAPEAQPTSIQVPILRPALSGNPGEMIIIEPKPGQTPEEAAREGERIAAEREKAQDDADGCETCKNRSYQDGSTDPGVSFKSPTQVNPNSAASMVKAHEQEHVTRNKVKAEREQREIISQSVQIHNAVCPECGKIYVSGGTTRTTSRAQAAKQYSQPDTRSGQQLSLTA